MLYFISDLIKINQISKLLNGRKFINNNEPKSISTKIYNFIKNDNFLFEIAESFFNIFYC